MGLESGLLLAKAQLVGVGVKGVDKVVEGIAFTAGWGIHGWEGEHNGADGIVAGTEGDLFPCGCHGVGVSVSWEQSVGGNGKARERFCHVETKTGMRSGNQVRSTQHLLLQCLAVYRRSLASIAYNKRNSCDCIQACRHVAGIGGCPRSVLRMSGGTWTVRCYAGSDWVMTADVSCDVTAVAATIYLMD